MATYEQVRTFVKDKHGKTMQSCWIAHAKEINKLPIKSTHNRKSSIKRVKPCPLKQLAWIEEAFRHFSMIK
jgi:hypothetical protein